MKPDENNVVLEKVDDLSGYLEVSRKSIPFMEDILAFVRDIVPVIDELKKSVELSSDKLPTASKQLDKVTTATEIASTEILNIVEGILSRIDSLQAPPAHVEQAAEIERRIGALVEPDRGSLMTAWKTYRESVVARDAQLAGGLAATQDDCTSIMIALQVQDITAQQIAAVNRLMASVDEGFSRLMKHLNGDGGIVDPDRFKHRHLDIVFDPNAEFTDPGARQDIADSVVEQTRLEQESGNTRHH